MASDAVALTTILMLAVTCFLAGVHFDGSFYWVSALLVLAAVIGTEVESYLWLVAVMFLIGVAITIISATLLPPRPTVRHTGVTVLKISVCKANL